MAEGMVDVCCLGMFHHLSMMMGRGGCHDGASEKSECGVSLPLSWMMCAISTFATVLAAFPVHVFLQKTVELRIVSDRPFSVGEEGQGGSAILATKFAVMLDIWCWKTEVGPRSVG